MNIKKIGELIIPLGVAGGMWAFFNGNATIEGTWSDLFLLDNPRQAFLIKHIYTPLIFCIGYFWSYFHQKYNLNKAWFMIFIVAAFIYPFTWQGTTLQTSCWFFIYACVICSLGMILYLGFDAQRRLKQQKELERQSLKSELALLKNQINPHFLFNTLNNIDSLIKTDTDKASETLIKLSDMLRYMIYDTNVEKVSLKEELEYIENYLKLQKIQFSNTDLVSYQVKGNISGIYVAPMLFIPFIENAFKHCTDKIQKGAICIHFTIEGQKILFECRNISDKSQIISKDKSSGVGLTLVKRRLDILYSGKYSLNIDEKNNLFCVTLKLNTK